VDSVGPLPQQFFAWSPWPTTFYCIHLQHFIFRIAVLTKVRYISQIYDVFPRSSSYESKVYFTNLWRFSA
jgi:hypothetical protein